MPWLIGLGLLALSHGLAYWSGSAVKEAEYQRQAVKAERDNAVAGLAEFAAEANRLQGLSAGLDQRINKLAEVRPTIVERYTRETVKTPLPADCRISPERLRIINDAITAANAAAAGAGKPATAVPAD
ncbi:hypothetical protein JW897_12365 [Chromobacterium alkanivorans]|uniref:hypothetical protein n=1 Tax=Chromobacterium alkanivorans TaxID=1071719 RepID=UPI00196839C7|nr:hypothetical protein [Chromobacterium alkanivorans]MBN3004530.1 hypothetical protein [Chromobacterium alkanivorans]